MTATGSQTRPNLRPVVHLTVSPGEPPIPMTWRPPSAPPRSARERLLLVAERAVGGLAPTLRAALLMLLCALAGLGMIAAIAGPVAALFSTLVLVVIALLRR
ncbi:MULTISPECIES: hypothetical protein [Actinokineospora]|uniref:Uncharacterized protein n=1 Tax=Actinokineospora fastidiosa TaxID=1816 RepID=A0A918G6E2_9PSEU|nr:MULTISPECIES: hypothetical protein [Actinokineospora]UVS82628.1 hypothetical protein Actkin_06402 [Actinokineospora sp. UTMC 2448]GGS19685.1 hypothetical protein GCM10010171_10370 [Actinokineospora fastidiosa]